jgi:hypothetical protein
MSSVRLTLAKNGNVKVRTVAVIKTGDHEEIMRVARNKLKLKKPSRLFDHEGKEITVDQVALLTNDRFSSSSSSSSLLLFFSSSSLSLSFNL